MAMVIVVNWQPTGGLMVQADRLDPKPKVGGHLAPCCNHVNQGELSQCFKHDDSTINIVLALLLVLLLLLLLLLSLLLLYVSYSFSVGCFRGRPI